jgi:hypothetical protein
MINYKKERLEFIINKEKEIKIQEQHLLTLQECNTNLNKYKNIIDNINNQLNKTTDDMNSLLKTVQQTDISINNDLNKNNHHDNIKEQPKNIVMENKNIVMENKNIVMENKNIVIENKNIINKQPENTVDIIGNVENLENFGNLDNLENKNYINKTSDLLDLPIEDKFDGFLTALDI